VAIVNVTDVEFTSEVLNHNGPVLIEFWAGWCNPCKRLAPEFEKLAEKFSGTIKFVKVDVDQSPVAAKSCNVMSLPTLVFFNPGATPVASSGFATAADLEKKFNLGGR
jgi:thioredoxin 1